MVRNCSTLHGTLETWSIFESRTWFDPQFREKVDSHENRTRAEVISMKKSNFQCKVEWNKDHWRDEGSDFVSTATRFFLSASLFPSIKERDSREKPFSMTIEFHCAKVRREVEKSISSPYQIFLLRLLLFPRRNVEKARLSPPVFFVTEPVEEPSCFRKSLVFSEVSSKRTLPRRNSREPDCSINPDWWRALRLAVWETSFFNERSWAESNIRQ